MLEQRIDLGALNPFFTYPVVGDGFFAMNSDGTDVFAKGATNWTIEARLGTGPATPVIDGSRLAMSVGSDGIGLFERQNGTWPMTMTVKAHDVSATNSGSPLALHGDVLAAGDQLNIGNGPYGGAVYTFTKTATSSAPDCSLSAIGPPRIEGAGTGCVEPGTRMARCPYITPGTSTVAGTTPYGAVSFPFAWADVTGGEGPSTTIEVSDVAPRRTGTSPTLGFRLGVAGDPPTAQPIPATFSLTLCSRTVTVGGQVTFDGSLTKESSAAELEEVLRRLRDVSPTLDVVQRSMVRIELVRKRLLPSRVVDALLCPPDAAGEQSLQGRPLLLTDPEPWPEPVAGNELLDELAATFRRHVVLPPNVAEALALWVLHTHAIAVADITPRLAILSPEKRCGKTTLLEVLGGLVRRPLQREHRKRRPNGASGRDRRASSLKILGML